MTRPLKAIDSILAGAEAIYNDVNFNLSQTGDMTIGELMDLRGRLQEKRNTLEADFNGLLGLYVSNSPTPEELGTATAAILGFLSGRINPTSNLTDPITLFSTVVAQGAAVMDAIEDDQDAAAGLNAIHGGKERALNTSTNEYEPLLITKAQRSALDTVLTALQSTLSPLF